jgi:hypothetical protein
VKIHRVDEAEIKIPDAQLKLIHGTSTKLERALKNVVEACIRLNHGPAKWVREQLCNPALGRNTGDESDVRAGWHRLACVPCVEDMAMYEEVCTPEAVDCRTPSELRRQATDAVVDR